MIRSALTAVFHSNQFSSVQFSSVQFNFMSQKLWSIYNMLPTYKKTEKNLIKSKCNYLAKVMTNINQCSDLI